MVSTIKGNSCLRILHCHAGTITEQDFKMLKLAIFALALTLSWGNLDANWLVYKKTYNKIYTEDEDNAHRLMWQINLQKIEQHNELYAKGLSSFYMGENQFTDMTRDEAVGMMNGFKVRRQLNTGNNRTGLYKDPLPAEVDWRKKGAVTNVKDQSLCVSGWAFSATGAVEGQHAIATGKLVSLSESNLLDCTQSHNNHGCKGGYVDNSFQYIIDNKGIDTEESYPYTGKDGKCKFDKDHIGATITSINDIEPGNEIALQTAVAKIGPISAYIDAGDSFTGYRGGIYDEPKCDSLYLVHSVLVVGYGSQDGKDYWIVKNSFGTSWGEEGYIRMSRNKNNQCGIASAASYPVV